MKYPVAPAETHPNVLYNVAEKDANAGSSDEFFYTVPDPPPIRLFEAEEVCNATRNCIIDNCIHYGLPGTNDRHEYLIARYSVMWSDLVDRTIYVSLSDLSLVREEIILALQEYVLSRWCLWRIWVWEEIDGADAEGVIIYPDAVVFGTLPQGTPLPTGVKEWKARAQIRWERRYGPIRRQINYVKSQLARALADLDEPGGHVAAICAFDNFDGDIEHHAIWTVQTFDGGWASFGDDTEWQYSTFAGITPDGQLGHKGTSQGSDKEVTIYKVPPADYHCFQLGNIRDTSWTYRVSLPVIMDAELRDQERRFATKSRG